jgi:hypothetical protein
MTNNICNYIDIAISVMGLFLGKGVFATLIDPCGLSLSHAIRSKGDKN